MKSRKFKAVLAAVSAIAVLATAMTGFAATITTETTYNVGSTNKATVRTIVSGLENKTAEVTLLVKTVPGAGVGGSAIAYIDQKPASAGEAIFEYQLDKTALSDATRATVITGNDSDNADDKIPNSTLNVKEIADYNGDTYTIDYNYQVYGNNDEKLVATITPVDGQVIDTVKIGGVLQNEIKATYDIAIENGVAKNVEVTTKAAVQAPNLTGVNLHTKTENGVVATTTVMKVEGNPDEVGVAYAGYTYKAERTADDKYVAVTLKAKADNNIIASMIKAYYVVDDEINTVAVVPAN